MDAFNPCAFFVLLFLLSLMIHGDSRRRLLLVGGVFVLCSGLTYFAFTAAWLNLFLLAGNMTAITLVAGLVAIVIGLINIKDFFWFKRGITLSVPEAAQRRLGGRMARLINEDNLVVLLGMTVLLALVANLYELLCTAGFPMVFTRALTLHELSTAGYYAYLALYNLVYVIPRLIIVLAFVYTLGARRLTERQGRLLKLMSGTMMLLLGLVLAIVPGWLGNVLAAFGIVVAALVVTLIMARMTREPGSTA